jgi:hypothetical protein
LKSRNHFIQQLTLPNLLGGSVNKFVFIMLSWCIGSTSVSALVLGVNLHQRNDRVISDIMKSRNFKSARIDLTANDNPDLVRAQVARIRANGGSVRASVVTSFERDYTCNQNLTAMELKAYNETTAIVDKYKDLIYDYELLNENTLRPETVNEVPFNSAGTSTLPYTGKTCYKTLTAVLRGMANAITHTRVRSGFPLRVILTVVGRDFGFLTFMQQQKVHFDVVGFIIYPRSEHPSLLNDAWYGSGGPFTQLSVFGRPVIINEYNCAEIYDTDYINNDLNSAKVKKCFQSYKIHMPELFAQNKVKLESVNFYELLDEPHKAGREGRFGLLYNLTSAKTHLSIISAYAGGALSATERQTIINLGILTGTQINAYKAIAE